MIRFVVAALLFIAVPLPLLAEDSPYRGWNKVAARLKEDGIPDSFIQKVYQSPQMPPFDFVPFKLAPRETHDMYTGFLVPAMIKKGKACLTRHRASFREAGRVFGVKESVIAAIILVESHCGEFLGKELVVNRLSRIGNIDDEENLDKNLEKMREADSSVTHRQVRDRARYLVKTFYPELRTLFEKGLSGELNIFTLRGSSAGAFGLPQFLPSTFVKYGVDGDRDGIVSLFDAPDAIWSVAHFLAAQGWRDDLGLEEKRAIIWKYNKSEPYIDTVLKLGALIR